MKRKVIIKKGPPQPKGEPEIKVRKVLQPVDRKDANMEIEKGEVAVSDTQFSGFPELYVAGGQNHSEGGTPVNLPAHSFIFSKDKSLRITDEDTLGIFNKTPKKIGYDPAEIAKQYQLNNYRKILADPNSDKLQRDTAELMIKNYNEKLGQLALVQESKKGFDKGIPFISIPYLENMGIDPAQFVHGNNSDEPETATNEEEDVPKGKFGGEFKIKVLQKFQPGGEKDKGKKKKPADSEFAYNPEFYQAMADKMGTDISAVFPSSLAETHGQVPNKQKATGKGTYGRKDWASPELLSDFKKRNQWYFAKNPNFDPTNPKDVEDFQRSYNAHAQSVGLPTYFKEPNSKAPSKYDIDKKFGEVTFSVPSLDPLKNPAPFSFEKPVTHEDTVDPLKKPDLAYKSSPENADFWTQDLINMAGAVGDYSRLKKYLPFQAGFQTKLPGATYYDPTRELAANAEQATIAAQELGTFTGPQNTSARVSDVQGKALENAANILGKYNELNVGIANTLEANRTNILNQDSQTRAAMATGLYDKTVMANESFNNAKAMARKNIRDSFINALTNRGETQALNSINKQFSVDPTTGFITATGKAGDLELSDTDRAANMSKVYDKLKKGRTEAEALKLFDMMYGGKNGASSTPNTESPEEFYNMVYGNNRRSNNHK